jgi:hypothetical protein
MGWFDFLGGSPQPTMISGTGRSSFDYDALAGGPMSQPPITQAQAVPMGTVGGIIARPEAGKGIFGAAGSGAVGSPQAVDLGWNVGTGQLALGGLQSLYNAWQASELAKRTFAFNKEIANTNLNNQIRSYNTQLEDRAGSRAAYMAESGGFDAAGYVDRNRARRG